LTQSVIYSLHRVNFESVGGILFAFLEKRKTSRFLERESIMLIKIKRLIHRIFPTGQEGFTLTEVIISMVIFATGLLMMIPMIVTSIKGNVFADMTTKAAHHIQAKVEEIKNTHTFSSGSDNPEGMTRTWIVEDYGTRLKKITVQMNWLDQDSLEHNNVVITYESYN
jgi:prepilin-type N-terminal cleavage/methylation domain-containing protein